jgi:uncharacterized RDD family membrane protein YckC
MSSTAYDLNVLAEADYGGFWIRLLATLIDSMLVFLPLGLILDSVFGVRAFVTPIQDSNQADLTMQVLISGLVYVPFWLSSWQGTPGKRLCGLAIIDRNGRPLTLGRAIGRYACLLLASLSVIGLILPVFMRRKVGLHDLLAGTLVVKRNALQKL